MNKVSVMKMLLATMSFFLLTGCGNSQKTTQTPANGIDAIINVKEVERIEKGEATLEDVFLTLAR